MQKKRFFVLTTVMLLLSIAMLAMPAVATGEATITRTITPSEVSDGNTYNVTLTVSFNTDEDSIVIHEALPADWNLTEVDSGRYIWNTSEEDYTFLDFYGTVNLTGVTDTITYSVTVPDETVSGTYDYGPSYVAGESASEEEFAWTVNTTGDDTVTVNGTILNIYSTALENTNPGAPDPGIPGFVGPNGDGKTDCGNVNPIFITWASTVVDYSPANQSIGPPFSDPSKALGPVTGDNFDIVSLGDLDQDQINAGELPGSVTLGFDLPIANGEGPDLAVFENGFIVSGTESIFAELAYVEVSTDGIVFARFPSISLTSGQVGGYGSIDPTDVYNLVGKHVNAYGDSWGTPFDLSNLAQAPEVLNGSVDLNSINYVRIVDIPGSGDFKDSQGNPIYDGWVTWGSGGLDLEAVGVINIGVVSAPVANFTADVTSGTAPLTVQFHDESTGVILDYAWDFDNDGIVDSTEQNPSFTYEAPGTYTVSLTVSNTGGSNTETKADYIVPVLPDSPVADFSVDVTSGSAPLTVQFTDLTTNRPVSWAWDFESDGIIDSYEQNPPWTYNAAGNYTVTMTASNLAASDTVTRVNLISVEYLPPMADFSADPVTTLIGSSVQFTDLSTNSPSSWQWDFNNDGTIDSTMQNPSYTYTTAGTYTVNLTVSNPAGSGDEVKSDYIIVKEQASPASDFTYTSDGSSITITKYIGSDGIVIIPAEIEGLPVTTIGTSAFQGCSALTTVTIPNSVTNIGDYAFMSCSALTAMTIPNSVISIGKYAFSSCSALTTLAIGSGVTAISDGAFYNCPSVTTVKIGSGVTNIGASAFQGCSALTTVTIPDGVINIGTSAFRSCSALTTVAIPDSVTSIGSSAFCGCSGLTIVTIGGGVTSIGGVTSSSSFAFSDCSALTAIDVDADNSVYTSIDGVLYNKDVTTLIRCPSGKTGSVAIPNSVTTISSYVFPDCSGLTTVTIGSGVTSIDNSVFSDCSALTAIDVDNDNSMYASIDGVLYNKDITTLIQCPSGKTGSVTIPDSVTTIGDSAFYGCTALTSVTIPDSVTTIGTSAFQGCISITSVNIGNNVTSIGNSAFCDCIALTSVTIGNNVISIGSYAFQGCAALTSVTIPDSVTKIGSSAFQGCISITSVNIGSGVTSIGNSAFRQCSALTTVTIPDSVTTILDYAFQDCSRLTTVTIGSGVTNIDSSAFSGCSALTAIDVDNDNSIYASIDGVLYNKDITTLIQCPSGKTGSVTIPDSVTTIGDSAFRDCSGLTIVPIGNNVTSIGSSAFYGCTYLTSVPIGNNVTSIGSSAFYGCTSLTSVTIGNNVTSISSSAFRQCSALTTVTIPDSVTTIGDIAFSDCSGLTTVTIGNNVTSIGSSAFYGCTALTLIAIPDSVTSIGGSAFRDCTNLTSVTIGNNVTSIGSSAFRSCTALTSMTFMGNAPTMGSRWASGCTNLVAYYYESATGFTTPTWNGVACYPLTEAPVADFEADVTSGIGPMIVNFTDLSTRSPDTWEWDFNNDGTIDSTEQNPSYTYTSAGTYTVNLTVANANGTDSEVKTDYITVSEPSTPAEPVAAFIADVTSGTVPLIVNFTDQSTGSPTSWLWDFGDGTNVTEQNPAHTYTAAGTYTVNLTVSNEDGSDSEVKTGYINVGSQSSAKPVAAFTASPTSGKTPLKVKFTDTSTGSPTSWFWNFGDGSKSYFQNPIHKYSKAGEYTVNLTVKNAKGKNTVTKTEYIKVITKPVANFSATPTSGKMPLKVKFTDTSTGIPAKWRWDFGDGSKSFLQNPVHKYSKAGTYTVNLTVKNAKGKNTVTKTEYIKVITKPVANFSANPTSGKAPLKVTFTDTSTGIPAKWRWDFGDGSKSFHQNPIHKYSKAGTYTVNLTVKNVKGKNTVTKTEYIKIT
ncbi:Chitin binding protein [Methanosarcina barkeri str. Wiesmoor]|uniref:Chitin binding protein n=2 Tax=Methanosarcina barkeri TaxID=2208 RepID=A0A0E3QNJ7_METBA|nr:leucine-rich repeat protein [Methanosarcina barkeri]AKB51994.1 Chitin binding protein [Methanosarcina barkeri str. Wiesmoor]